ncbi:MAG: YdcF family protein [Bacteroidetes bacterium]|nr:YdcF family protein [Bacteroidota bacterium]
MKQYWSDIKGFVLLMAILLFVLAIDIVGVSFYHHHVQQFLANQPEIHHADAGLVFFGDYEDDGRALGPASKQRAGKAVELYHDHIVRHVICVGGYDYRHWRGKPNLMSDYLQSKGVPADCILYDSLSFNTNTNWHEASIIIAREHFDTIIAISSPLHIFRIANMINQEGVYYTSYTCSFTGFNDYWQLYLDVHHEWVSTFLSLTLRDEVRNRIVYIVRTVMGEVENFF